MFGRTIYWWPRRVDDGLIRERTHRLSFIVTAAESGRAHVTRWPAESIVPGSARVGATTTKVLTGEWSARRRPDETRQLAASGQGRNASKQSNEFSLAARVGLTEN